MVTQNTLMVRCIHKNGLITFFMGKNAIKRSHMERDKYESTSNPIVRVVLCK